MNSNAAQAMMAARAIDGPPYTLMEFTDRLCKKMGMTLYPRQRLFLKCVQNYAINPDQPCLLSPEEEDDLEFLLSRNDVEQQMILRVTPGAVSPFIAMFVAARGVGKTTLGGLVGSYLATVLAKMANPHGFYGLAATKPLHITNVATSEGTAMELFETFKTFIGQVKSLESMIEVKTSLVRFGEKLVARPRAATPTSGRSGDEVAFFYDEMAWARGSNNVLSAEELWKAYFNSVESRAGPRGLCFALSSPGIKSGKFYELYQQCFREPGDGGLPNCLMMQIATWNMRADRPRHLYVDKSTASPLEFLTENAAQFVSAVHTYLGEELVKRCQKPHLKRQERGLPGVRYVMHLDPSRVRCRYALAVAHKVVVDGLERIIIDHLKYWDPKEEGGMVNPKEVEAYVLDLCKRFAISRITFDQMDSQTLIRGLLDKGLPAEELTFTEPINYRIYRNFETMLRQDQFWTYPDEALESEMLHAEKELRGRIWKDEEGNEEGMLFSVHAPRSGEHRTDDILDAVAAACFTASVLPAGHGLLGPGQFNTVMYGPGDSIAAEHRTFVDRQAPEGWKEIQVDRAGGAKDGDYAVIGTVPYLIHRVIGNRLYLEYGLISQAAYGEPVMIVPSDPAGQPKPPPPKMMN